jgi:hypothetical protein
MLCGDELVKLATSKRHSVRNFQFMKVIRDVQSLFEQESWNIKNNQQILLHMAILEHVCVALKTRESTLEPQ